MLQNMKKTKENTSYDWAISDPPKVGIIITHYNYSQFVEKAIDSILSQTYKNYECIVVDDHSHAQHREKLAEIVSRKNGKINVILNQYNKGQLLSFYEGIAEIDAEFYCLLDPDDQYLPTFIEELVHIHLNPYLYVPMVCCNQKIYRGEQQIGGTLLRNKNGQSLKNITFSNSIIYQIQHYVGPDIYWPWTSASSMMFRKDALKLLFSEKLSIFKSQADGYLAQGCHILGGTLVYDKALVKRGFHKNNYSRKNHVIAITESRTKSDTPNRVERQKEHAIINILNNDGIEFFGKKHFREVLKNQFSIKELFRIRKSCVNARKMLTLTRILKFIFSNPSILFRK